MDIGKPMRDLMRKDMDRKEFLAHVGAAAVALTGAAAVVKTLRDPKQHLSGVSNGYGNSAYGGGERRVSTLRRQLG